MIHSVLLRVYFLRGAAEAGNKADKDGGMGGGGGVVVEGCSRGGVVGRKPKAMSLKKTLNSREERTVEPAIISWQRLFPVTFSLLYRAVMGNTDQSVRVEIWLFQCYFTVITRHHDTYMRQRQRDANSRAFPL